MNGSVVVCTSARGDDTKNEKRSGEVIYNHDTITLHNDNVGKHAGN